MFDKCWVGITLGFALLTSSIGAFSATPAQIAQNDALDKFAHLGDIEGVKTVVNLGVVTAYPGHVLGQAVRSGNVTTVAYLLDHGFQANALDYIDGLPLAIAAKEGQLPLVKVLLDHGADVNAKSKDDPALIAAVTNGNVDIVTLLLEHGANVNIAGRFSASALHAALQYHPLLVKLLLDHNALVNVRDDNTQTPLMVAARYGHIDAIKLLLAHGANAVLKDKEGNTCVDIANDVVHPETLKYLMSATHLKPRHAPHINRTLLIYAGHAMPVSKVDLLAEAAGHSDFEGVTQLLARHVSIDGIESGGSTSLSAAIASGDVDMMAFLLSHGANMYRRGDEGVHPIDDAFLSGRLDIFKVFAEHGIRTRDLPDPMVFQLALKTGNPDIIHDVIVYGAPIDKEDTHGFGLITRAAWRGNLPLVELLLNAGASPNILEKETGMTSLMMAASSGRLEVIKLLLDHGANLSLKDYHGKTALDYANDGYHPKTLAFLQNALAKVPSK